MQQALPRLSSPINTPSPFMSLRPETLHPLTLASFVLDYRLEGHPLQVVAKRLSYPGGNDQNSSQSSQEITLLLSAGIGCSELLGCLTLNQSPDNRGLETANRGSLLLNACSFCRLSPRVPLTSDTYGQWSGQTTEMQLFSMNPPSKNNTRNLVRSCHWL